MPNEEGIVGVRTALVSVVTRDMSTEEAEVSLAELARLLETAGGVAAMTLLQNKETPDVRTYLGSGKVAELAFLCARNEITLAVFDCELSPSRQFKWWQPVTLNAASNTMRHGTSAAASGG